MVTPSQFAWACCRAGDFPPPESKRGARFGADPVCCLCGGETAGAGWHRKDAIGPTFTDFARLARPASMTACQSCVATSKSEGWIQYVAAHPQLWAVCHYVAQRPEGWEPPARMEYAPAKDVSENTTRKEKAPPERGQIGLF